MSSLWAQFVGKYLHYDRFSLDEPILDQQDSYIDERQLFMWRCR